MQSDDQQALRLLLVYFMRRFLLLALGMGLLLTKPVYSEPDKLLFVDAHSQLPNSQLSDEIIHLLNQAGIKKVILSHRRLAKNKDILTLSDKYPNRVFPIIKTKGKPWIDDYYKFTKKIERKLKEGGINLQEESKINVLVNPSKDYSIKEGERAIIIP